MKNIVSLFLLTIMIGVFGPIALATESPQISIRSDGPLKFSSPEHNITVQVIFHDLSLYNEHVKLSYHIYDEDGNVLAFENERIPLMINDGTVVVDLTLDISAAMELSTTKKVHVKFDVVDEKNAFWVSQHPDITHELYETTYDGSVTNKSLSNLDYILSNQKIQLVASVSALLFLVIVWRKYEKEYRILGGNDE